jgi:recombination protein RecT
VQHLIKSEKGAQARMWREYLDDMIVKHAIKRAFKRQFGIEVAEDEYGTAAAEIPAYEPQRRDITEEANAVAGQRQPEPQQDRPSRVAPPYDDDATKETALRQEMNAKFKQLGISGKDAKAAYIAEKGVVKGETPTLQELTKLVKLMDIDIAKRAAQASDDDDLLGGE